MEVEAIIEPTLSENDEDRRHSIKDKWQGAVTEGSGFVAVPMALLRLQSKYGLTATELLVLINLLAHWWDASRAVFPRVSIIAKRMDVDVRTVQRCVQKLEKKGLLGRDRMEDGRRVFTFDVLAKRLAKDVTLAYAIHAGEMHGA